MSVIIAKGVPVISGAARGEVLFSDIALSFWGGVDAHTSEVIDKRHDLYGRQMAQKILCLPYGRGSCSSSGIIVEMVRAGTAPAAIIAREVEGILAVGSIIAKELYGRWIPVYTVGAEDYARLAGYKSVAIEEDGRISACDFSTS